MIRMRAFTLLGVIGFSAALFPVTPLLSAQSPQQSDGMAPRPAAKHSAYQPSRFPKRAVMYYSGVWGIDELTVKSAESGELIRFNYRILDPAKAAPLNNKKFEPSLIDPRAGVKLVVPSLEKVGQLRQSGSPQAGKVYWMAFSNKGGLVKRGDHVIILIGNFRASGLVVE